LIVPDLPGFGRSDYTLGSDYSIQAQVERLQLFLSQLQLSNRYHLVGSSMGGHIAGLYSLSFPHEIASLTLINSGGVLSPSKSTLDKQVEETGTSIFEVDSIEGFKKVFEMTLSDPPWMPSIVLNHVGQNAIDRTQRHRSIFSQIYQQDLLDEQLRNIRTPTLILWGGEDQLLHLTMAKVFHENIQDSKLVILPQSGHLPFLEKPSASADIYNRFISNNTQ
jgi:pimeloyl-ACP methyl ester carboxylesterase